MQVEEILIDLEKSGGGWAVWEGYGEISIMWGVGMTIPTSTLRVATSLCTREAYATALPWHISPSGASRHLPRRGRLDATALPWQRGDAPQGYLFRFAPLRGHRPLRKVCRGLRSVWSGHIFFLMAEMAPFSRRDTWAWEIPISVETSIWVLPWQKRRARMLRWRSSRRAMASLRAM